MCEVQDAGKVTVELSVVGFVLVCVSVNECTAQLADNGDDKRWDCVTGVMQPSTAFCVWDFPTVGTVQRYCCSAAQ